MFISRQIQLTRLLEAFIAEHAAIAERGGGRREVTILDEGGPVDVPPLEGGGRSLARPAALFLEELEANQFRLTDDYLEEDPTE